MTRRFTVQSREQAREIAAANTVGQKTRYRLRYVEPGFTGTMYLDRRSRARGGYFRPLWTHHADDAMTWAKAESALNFAAKKHLGQGPLFGVDSTGYTIVAEPYTGGA